MIDESTYTSYDGDVMIYDDDDDDDDDDDILYILYNIIHTIQY